MKKFILFMILCLNIMTSYAQRGKSYPIDQIRIATFSQDPEIKHYTPKNNLVVYDATNIKLYGYNKSTGKWEDLTLGGSNSSDPVNWVDIIGIPINILNADPSDELDSKWIYENNRLKQKVNIDTLELNADGQIVKMAPTQEYYKLMDSTNLDTYTSNGNYVMDCTLNGSDYTYTDWGVIKNFGPGNSDFTPPICGTYINVEVYKIQGVEYIRQTMHVNNIITGILVRTKTGSTWNTWNSVTEYTNVNINTDQDIYGTKTFKDTLRIDKQPTHQNDATNKLYVDTRVNSISNYVTTNTTQNITGTKTFSQLHVPTPTQITHPVTKQYADDLLNNVDAVLLTGNQSIDGQKTFLGDVSMNGSLIINTAFTHVNDPTMGTAIANKQYVDNEISNNISGANGLPYGEFIMEWDLDENSGEIANGDNDLGDFSFKAGSWVVTKGNALAVGWDDEYGNPIGKGTILIAKIDDADSDDNSHWIIVSRKNNNISSETISVIENSGRVFINEINDQTSDLNYEESFTIDQNVNLKQPIISDRTMAYTYRGEFYRTYFCWIQDANLQVWVNYYDHNSKQLGTPVAWGIPRTNANDVHAVPSITVSNDGYIIISQEQLSGTGTNNHNTPHHIRRSTNSEDITSWAPVAGSPFSTNIAYGKLLHIGEEIHFMSRGSKDHIRNFLSKDQGVTWETFNGTPMANQQGDLIVDMLSTNWWAYHDCYEIEGGLSLIVRPQTRTHQLSYPTAYNLYTKDGRTWGNWQWFISNGVYGWSKNVELSGAITITELNANECIITGNGIHENSMAGFIHRPTIHNDELCIVYHEATRNSSYASESTNIWYKKIDKFGVETEKNISSIVSDLDEISYPQLNIESDGTINLFTMISSSGYNRIRSTDGGDTWTTTLLEPTTSTNISFQQQSIQHFTDDIAMNFIFDKLPTPRIICKTYEMNNNYRGNTIFNSQVDFYDVINMNNSSRIINVMDPMNPQDVATKAYVDANSGGGGGGSTPLIPQYVTTSNTTTTSANTTYATVMSEVMAVGDKYSLKIIGKISASGTGFSSYFTFGGCSAEGLIYTDQTTGSFYNNWNLINSTNNIDLGSMSTSVRNVEVDVVLTCVTAGTINIGFGSAFAPIYMQVAPGTMFKLTKL